MGLSGCLNMHLSLLVERKVPKERHVRKVPTVLSLRILSPYLRAISPEVKWQRAVRSRFAVWPRCRRHGRPPRIACRFKPKGFFYLSIQNSNLRLSKIGYLRADGAPPFVRVFGSLRHIRAVRLFRPPAKEPRCLG